MTLRSAIRHCGWVALILAVSVGLCASAIAVETPGPQLESDAPPQTLPEQIDGVFAKAVSVVETVLFHRLFQYEREYVTYSHRETYVRDRGTTGPFVRLQASEVGPNELSDQVIRMLSARGELVAGQTIAGQPQPYRWARVDGRPVEAVSVTVPSALIETVGQLPFRLQDGDKFVKTTLDGKTIFAKVGAMRGLLDRTIALTPEDVANFTRQGVLAVDSNGQSIQRESVGGIPIIVLWLGIGGVVATFYLRFVNFWGFYHAIECVGGKFDNPHEAGEVNHFQALASALSGTVGLGNIAGVTIAMSTGGPGAFFWMLMSAFLGMTLKCVECTLGLKYRQVHADGSVLGGPMLYLSEGLKKKGLAGFGSVLAILFTILCILGSFGGGNMLQVNQAGAAMLQMLQQDDLDERGQLDAEIRAAAKNEDDVALKVALDKRQLVDKEIQSLEGTFKPMFGAIMAAMVAVVIMGGIKRIGKAAEKLIPTMCGVYILACLYIIFRHVAEVPAMIALVFSEAFAPRAVEGGILGVLVVGVQRAVFSNEAGAGSAPIAHSAARTEEPIREGMVALLEPFIDTIIVCSMSALAMLMCGAWNNVDWNVNQGLRGAALTSRAFQSEVSWFPYVLAISVTLFAFSTIISWSYYGERCWERLFGRKATMAYRVLAITAVFVGSVVNLGSVLDFSDMMILGMAFPNVLGLYFLLGEVRSDLTTYWTKYKTGQFHATPETTASEIA